MIGRFIDAILIRMVNARSMIAVDQTKFTQAVAIVRNIHTYTFTHAHVTTLRKVEGKHRKVQVRVKTRIANAMGEARNALVSSIR